MRRQYEYYTYILLCSDGSYYTGITRDLTARVSQHQLGRHPMCYTYKRRPVKLVYNACFNDVYEAIAWEKRIQRWSRKKKEALIRGAWEELPELARCQNITEVFRNKKLRRIYDDIRDRLIAHLSPLVFPHGSTGSP